MIMYAYTSLTPSVVPQQLAAFCLFMRGAEKLS
jgi:hypothetical protein